MKHFTFYFIPLLIFLFHFSNLRAQNSFNSSGGNGTGDDGTISYTIGQTFYNTNISDAGSEAQGIQQAFEISIVSSLPEYDHINLNIQAYPNPTFDNLLLKIDVVDSFTKRSYQLFDLYGKLIDRKEILSTETIIEMEALEKATYILKIQNQDQEIKTFKIIKN